MDLKFGKTQVTPRSANRRKNGLMELIGFAGASSLRSPDRHVHRWRSADGEM
jgi:hypothetical protein